MKGSQKVSARYCDQKNDTECTSASSHNITDSVPTITPSYSNNSNNNTSKDIGGGGGGNGGGGGGGVQTGLSVKCDCAGKDFSAVCGNWFGLTKIKFRGDCTKKAGGPDVCNALVNGKYYQYKSCAAVIKTPTPTKKAGKGTPTPTVNPLCVCSGTNICSPQCSFNKLTGVNYGAQVKCAPLPANRYSTAVTQANKNDWCRRPNRTKGDADGNDLVTFLDYFYLVSSQFGGKIPAKINADFNGDGLVNQADRQIIIKTLKAK